jgi:hypothetical protein
MSLKYFALVAPLAMLTAVALPAATPPKAAAPPAATATGPVDLQTATCGQFQNALYLADPGKNPTKDRQETAIAAQDVLIQGLMWVNGYSAGRKGVKAMQTFDKDYITGTIEKLNVICKANGKAMRFVDAAAKL